ncbi:DNA cytosine methyltransferase [Kribbella sp. CA-293567]|uniref:DNA cytosine methyltransferase n=1 Tax=Kribbella sp. CA-293567 TaxID=3002436 RepID=UPI0022DE75C1|nr:DNA cytosine methyltransferase [Kribbella sp. CA-293567]WBQ05060.1 DNA cytosine methyltransferase [Kribbella sp. CA-293567]
MRKYEMGELFCGAGGLSRGFHAHGFDPRFANDIWDLAVHNFLMNFDKKYAKSGGKMAGDIVGLPGSVEDIDPSSLMRQLPSSRGTDSLVHGELDVLLGGPPCQGFSVNSHIRNGDDPRNSLFKHYVRILKGFAPKIFVLENVPGMFSLEGGRFFDELLSEIKALNSLEYGGYEISFKILNAAHYGVPQERFRMVVIGTRRDIADEVGKVDVPEPVHYSLARAHFKGGRTHTFHYALGHRRIDGDSVLPLHSASLLPPVSVEEAIGDLPPLVNGGGVEDGVPYGRSGRLSEFQKSMRRGAKAATNHWARALFPPNTERVKHIPEGGDWRSIPFELLPPGMQRALRKDHTTRYGRLSRNQLAGTLLTKPDPHWGTFIHYDVAQQRLISVREAARFQSFPDIHTFYGGQVDQYRLCGNAVPPLLAEAVAVNVKQKLDAYGGLPIEIESEFEYPLAVNV